MNIQRKLYTKPDYHLAVYKFFEYFIEFKKNILKSDFYFCISVSPQLHLNPGLMRNFSSLISICKSKQQVYLKEKKRNRKMIRSISIVLVTLFFVDVCAYWRPTPMTNWTWQLLGTIDTSKNVMMYDIDLWDTPATTITALKQRGKAVICYFRYFSKSIWQ